MSPTTEISPDSLSASCHTLPSPGIAKRSACGAMIRRNSRKRGMPTERAASSSPRAIAVGIISGAYQGEIFRGAFHAIARGELEAARSVGMPRLLLFRRIIAPQALRFAIPGLGNVWQLALKESALISVVGLTELLRQAQVGAGSTRQPFEFFITAAVLYLLLSTCSGMAFARAEAVAMRGVRRS